MVFKNNIICKRTRTYRQGKAFVELTSATSESSVLFQFDTHAYIHKYAGSMSKYTESSIFSKNVERTYEMKFNNRKKIPTQFNSCVSIWMIKNKVNTVLFIYFVLRCKCVSVCFCVVFFVVFASIVVFPSSLSHSAFIVWFWFVSQSQNDECACYTYQTAMRLETDLNAIIGVIWKIQQRTTKTL